MSIIQIFKKISFISTLKHSFTYLIGRFALKGMAFIALPIMTRILSTNDYGIINVFNSYVNLFIVIFSLNTYMSIGRYYYEKNNDLKQFFGTLITFNLFLMLIISSILVVFTKNIALLINLPVNCILMFIPLHFFKIGNSWFEQFYIPQKKSLKISLRNIISEFSTLGLSIFLIILLNNNKYMGSIYAKLIVSFIFIFFYIFDLKKYYQFSFKLKHLKYLLHYSLPLLPYSLSGIILVQFDRIMINSYTGSSDAGLYSFAYNIGMLLMIIIGSIQRAWLPDYYKNMDKKDYKKIEIEIGKIFKIITLSSIALIYLGKEIGMLLAAKKFHSALPIVPIIVIGYIFYGIFDFYSLVISYSKKNIYLSIIVLSSGVLNILLNAYFIPKYGYFIAAYTTAISYFMMFILIYISVKFFIKIYYPSLLIFMKYIIIILPFIFVYYFMDYWKINYIIIILLKITICLLAFLLLYSKMIISQINNMLKKSE